MTYNERDFGGLDVVVQFVDDVVKEFQHRRLLALQLGLDERRPQLCHHVPVALGHQRALVFTEHHVQRTLHIHTHTRGTEFHRELRKVHPQNH